MKRIRLANVLLVIYWLSIISIGGASFARLASIYHSGQLFYVPVQAARYASSFVTFYGSGVLANKVLAGEKLSIYSTDLQGSMIDELIEHRPLSVHEPVYYPTFDFFLFSLLARQEMFRSWLLSVSVALLLNIYVVDLIGG